MVKHLIGFVGTSEAGKTTLSNYLHGQVLSKLHNNDGKPAISNYRLNEFGKLEIETDNYLPEDDKWETNFSELDVDNRSADFQMWARGSLWNFCKSFSLAHPLKQVCIQLLGLKYSQVHGTGKKTETEYKWSDFSDLIDVTGKDYSVKLTAREVMEYFGTKIMRSIDQDIYPKRLVEQLHKEHGHIGVITDIRRFNEAKILQEQGCILIRLTRGNTANISEVDINDIKPNYVIDNINLTQAESCQSFDNIINELGLFDKPE